MIRTDEDSTVRGESPLLLEKGRKRKGDEKMMSERKNPEELSTLKIIGRILEVLALALLIVNFILMNMKDKDFGTIGIILVTASIMVFIGLILSHLPQERTEGKKESAK